MTAPVSPRAGRPTWPALAGWFGTLLALLWLVDPASFGGPTAAVTVLLLAAGVVGACRRLLVATDLPDRGWLLRGWPLG
ncbi:MAG: hypothetical protein V5A61_17770 [Haloarculaceae archaeon]